MTDRVLACGLDLAYRKFVFRGPDGSREYDARSGFVESAQKHERATGHFEVAILTPCRLEPAHRGEVALRASRDERLRRP
jgi:hypothetical protein